MKYEFASPEWLAALHGIIADRVALEVKAKPNLMMSLCEVFYNAPAHLAGEGGRLSWSSVVQGAKIDFRRSERDDVRLKVMADYVATLPLCRFSADGNPTRTEELQSMITSLVAAGKLTFVGERGPTPDSLSPIHDTVAKLTA